VEQKTAETMDVDMRLTSRIGEPCQRLRKLVICAYLKSFELSLLRLRKHRFSSTAFLMH
jgi:hypothetical protein